ncbi:MAG: CD1871A family CXXC motif-containing protein [Bacillota bacterium]|nr:CD1871A family CXXC motif-containing protein [Bacillota bacterium]
MKREAPLKVTIALIPLAIGLCALGIYRGEAAIVLAKAINICMECIGLG